MKVEVTQSCPTLCDHMDCSPPGSSVHGILQARILEWVDILLSRGPSWPRNQTQVSCIAGRFLICRAIRKALVPQSYMTLCDSMDYSPTGFSVHGILQVRILEWVTIPFWRSSWPKDRTRVSCIVGKFFTSWATREAPFLCIGNVKTPQAIQKEI